MEDKSTNSNTSSISVPKGGGSISGIGETFSPNLFSGTGNFSVPIYTSPSRQGFSPQLALSYSTGSGNGIFGLGWQLSIPRITRKTEKGLPNYGHKDNLIGDLNKDVFVLSGAEDLVPVLTNTVPNTIKTRKEPVVTSTTTPNYNVTLYQPRTEGLYAKIEFWEKLDSNNNQHIVEQFWRVISKDNVTSIYGRTSQARIAQLSAGHKEKVYEWLLEESFDSKGNHIYYEYAADIATNNIVEIFEENRDYYNRYPRRILYGNVNDTLTDYNGQNFTAGVKATTTDHRDILKSLERSYIFEVIFNYDDWGLPMNKAGDFDYQKKINALELLNNTKVPVRPDPFSSFRPGFELRTLRRCSNVLMIHHFVELGSTKDKGIIVKSTDFDYVEATGSHISLLQSATLTGYQKESTNKYTSSSMPPVEFAYSDFRPKEQTYESVTANQKNIPTVSLNSPNISLVDLFGNGLQDVVQTDASGFRYWRNLGDGQLEQPHVLHESPSGFTLQNAGVSFADLSGNGLTDLLVMDGPVQGFYELEPEVLVNNRLQGGWSSKSFKKFSKRPNINLADPNLKMLDLTGDGLSDILIDNGNEFIWYQSLGENGYSDQKHVLKQGELKTIHFNDQFARIRFSDMSGDGLQDIVQIHNGSINYWPNLGYGRFGSRISMKTDDFQLPLDFNPKRLFLVDLDGSGTADIVYVDFNQVTFWFNQSGNSLSKKNVISGTPITLDNTALSFTDFYSTGTSALIWSYDLGTVADSNYKVLDFCGKEKPYLLTEMKNNLGATTRVKYASSTKFYLEDVKQKQFWVRPLPFPVQVVEKTESIDHISKTKLVTSYKYHHGFYDGREREFRGFGRVDQIDTEFFAEFSQNDLHSASEFVNKNVHLHAPPVETRTWFHTGAYFEEDDILAHYKKEYLSGLSNLADNERPQDNSFFNLGSNKIETNDKAIIAQAHRVLRGSIIRTELYAHDNSADTHFPYTVSDNVYRIKTIQELGIDSQGEVINKHAVFQNIPEEQISYHYERAHSGRNLIDPRIQHEIILETNEFGSPLKSASIAYKRRQTSFQEQAMDKISVSENQYCHILDDKNNYRHSFAFDSKQYELTGLNRVSGGPYTKSLLATGFVNAQNIAYEDKPAAGQIESRLLSHSTTLFWKHDLSAAENLGVIGAHALVYETYTLALTPGLRNSLYGSGQITNALGVATGYKSKQANQWGSVTQGDWWIPSGKKAFSANHFFQAIEATDIFGQKLSFKYDPYSMFPVAIQDPLGSRTEGLIDYRVLQTYLTRDVNGNHSEVVFDALGMLVASAVMGKAGRSPNASLLDITQTEINQLRSNTDADSLIGVVENLPNTTIQTVLQNPDGSANAYDGLAAHQVLQQASSRVVYDLNAFKSNAEPVVACSIVREQHYKDQSNGPLQISYNYSDGFGREIQTKVQAEPIVPSAPSASIKRRWLVSGWTVFNNKAKPVQQYEPGFTDNIGFEEAHINGVSTTLFYDPLQRVVCTLHPNNTYEKVIINPWQTTAWDANDTVLLEPQNDSDVKDYVAGFISTKLNFKTWFQNLIPDPANLPVNPTMQQQAAVKTIEHANTPSITHLDVLGAVFLSINNNKTETIETKLEIDIQGNELSITDARNVKAFEHGFDMAGRKLVINSVDAGLKKIFMAADNNIIYNWDANGNQVETRYDVLRRPTEVFVTQVNGLLRLVDKIIYGEQKSQSEVSNLRGLAWKHYDGAGLAVTEKFDFKGNILEAKRRLLKDAKNIEINWPRNTSGNFDETEAVKLLETDNRLNTSTYALKTQFDALNRVVENTLPDGSKQTISYNPASLLESISNQHVGTAVKKYVENIDYNEKGQRSRIEYGNGTYTTYAYESGTFRLQSIKTIKQSDASNIQDLSYTYDPVGNITSIRDDAHARIFNRNQVVDPVSKYTYDAVYRLIEASGREHESMTACHYQTNGKKHTEFLPMPQSTANAQALLNYIEKYQYDKTGNILRIEHSNALATRIRNQDYQTQNNRLTKSDAGCANESSALTHDANGNITALPHLPGLAWDYKNQLVEVQLNVGANSNKAYYQYDSQGQRIRKLVAKNNGNALQERIYIGPYEIYTETVANNITLQRDSIHVSDDKGRIALIDRERDANNTSVIKNTVKRFLLSNHLGSSSQELDDTGQRISYEEYYPYGGTAYQAGKNQSRVSLKRYRYSGKERDDETGLYYYGARYYAPWLGRWINTDPIGIKGGMNLFMFSANSPIGFKDDLGYEPSESDLNNVNYDTESETCFEAASCADGMTLVNQNIEDGSSNLVEKIEPSGVETSSLKGKFGKIIIPLLMVFSGSISAIEKANPDLLPTPPDIINGDYVDDVVAGVQDEIKSPPPPEPPPSQKLLTDGGKGKQKLLTDGGKGKQKLVTDGGKGKQKLLTDGGKNGAGNKAPGGKLKSGLKGAGAALGVVGSGLNGYKVGTGVNEIIEGKTAEGLNHSVWTGTGLVVELGGAKAVEAGVLAAGGGAAALLVTGVAMGGSLWLAEESISAALEGRPTPIDEAGDFYVDWALQAFGYE